MNMRLPVMVRLCFCQIEIPQSCPKYVCLETVYCRVSFSWRLEPDTIVDIAIENRVKIKYYFIIIFHARL